MPPRLQMGVAGVGDEADLAALHLAVAQHLTNEYGRGHWSTAPTENAVRRTIETSRVLVARNTGAIVATLTLATRKPWAIDPKYFAPVRRPLYLTSMAVTPEHQERGVGRRMLDEAREIARAWPADAIRLDSYDATAGAGAFYAKCGFREVGRAVYRKSPLVYYELIL